ncbi:MAG: zinc-dependent metalloprotease [Phycisphaerales bacterium]
MNHPTSRRRTVGITTGLAALVASMSVTSVTLAQDFRPFDEVAKGYTKVETSPGEGSLFNLFVKKKDGQMLAELPRGWQNKKFFIAATPSGGVIFSGLQGPARYVYWKQYDKRIALIEPNLDVRSSGEAASRENVDKIFPDRVLLDVPIVALGPGKQPVIDLDQLLVGNSSRLSGINLNGRLASIEKAKSFPENLEISVKAPSPSGAFMIVHYSISEIKNDRSYRPREADDRIGYFTTDYKDLGEYGTETNWNSRINRWKLEKRDTSLKLSPPKEPIVFYIEDTVPVRYRRYVREGILQWNVAFEKIGILNAIEVRQQDSVTGQYMDIDPEDVRYNFVRWLNNDISTAIGPSRAHPVTGQILDADIVLTDGWIRAFYGQWEDRPAEEMDVLSPETRAWLEDYPQWDPRIQLLPPNERAEVLANRAARAAAGDPDPADSFKDPIIAANPELAEIVEWAGCDHALCLAAHGKARDMAFAGLQFEVSGMVAEAEARGEQLIDGIPESFIGPQLAHLTVHEVGHTLGLRHNFKSSSIYTLDEVNSEEFKGKITNSGSVMDYLPTNWNVGEDGVQGDYAMIGIGPYDMWAIEFGYTFGDVKEVLAKVGDPKHVYLTDDDTGGPDPLARRYDYTADPLQWAESVIDLVGQQRGKLLTEYVKDGDSWERARRGYLRTLSQQRRMIGVMTPWVGGTHVARVKKGDPGTGAPLTPVDPDYQREALDFVIANAFQDEAFGMSPELLNKMTTRKWSGGLQGESTWPVHQQIAGVQNMAVTMILNPTTLARVYDNELRTPAGEDALTLPELFGTLFDAVYTELGSQMARGDFSDREPMISSLRRSLQADMTDRLVAIATNQARLDRPIRQQALFHLRQLDEMLEGAADGAEGAGVDTYTLAHIQDMHMRTSKALDAIYITQ